MRTSKTTKNAYLAKLTENIQMRSVDVGKDLDGSTPPSVFIGRWSYPKVYAGPMMVPQLGDTSFQSVVPSSCVLSMHMTVSLLLF